MLENLVNCIESLRARIREHRSTLAKSETRTRTALIDPLLRELGWDVSDPSLVTPEYRVSGGSADYALLDHSGSPSAVVEAKKLGEPLAGHRMQMLNYANASGIKYAGLTNGNDWELYDVFQPVELHERRLLDLSLSDASASKSALELLLLWRTNLAIEKPTKANAPILDVEQTRSKNDDRQSSPDSSPRSSSDWISLSEYNPPAKTPPPKAIRFWDNKHKTLETWSDILLFVVEKLHAEGRLTSDRVPIGSTDKTYIVNTKAEHPKGKPFAHHKTVADTLFINMNLNAGQVRSNTRNLLEHCSISPASVHLQAR